MVSIRLIEWRGHVDEGRKSGDYFFTELMLDAGSCWVLAAEHVVWQDGWIVAVYADSIVGQFWIGFVQVWIV